MLTGLQIRAARALLRWSLATLAKRAEINVNTVIKFEKADGIPSANLRTIEAIKKTLEAQGIEFVGTQDDAPGVRLRRKA